jgi:glycosyltransferase involved in cell wall biosynthesis
MKKIAIIHDQLKEFGGAERVLIALKKIFPESDVYTSFYDENLLGVNAPLFRDWQINTSWAQKIPLLKNLYSPLRFITPYIWEALNLNDYDIVISSSGAYMCKGVITRPETKHISYIHHPPKYLYYYETSRDWQKHWPIKAYGNLINHSIRIWDYLSSQRPDVLIANSVETQSRINKYYRRDSVVIYPPVDLAREEDIIIDLPKKFTSNDSYYVTTSRLSKAKHIDILIKASNKYGFRLKIIGSGQEEDNLRNLSGNNVEFFRNIKDSDFKNIYSNAKGFLFASVDEEFGISPVEAMSYGLPVIAFASGGLKETVEDGKNGFLYKELSEESVIQAVMKLESLSYEEYTDFRKQARCTSERFSFEIFKSRILSLTR